MQIQLPQGGEQDSEEMDSEEQASGSGNQVPLLSLAAQLVQFVCGGIYVLHSIQSNQTALLHAIFLSCLQHAGKCIMGITAAPLQKHSALHEPSMLHPIQYPSM